MSDILRRATEALPRRDVDARSRAGERDAPPRPAIARAACAWPASARDRRRARCVPVRRHDGVGDRDRGARARVEPAPAASTPASSVTSVASATPSRPRGARVAPARQELAAVPSPTLAPSSQPATPPPSDHAASPPSSHTVERARRSRPRAGAEVTRTAPGGVAGCRARAGGVAGRRDRGRAVRAVRAVARGRDRGAVSPRPRRALPRQRSAAALAAWDAYLAAEPQGRFAIEARYNRALVLARLGRYRDAHAALVPFARGEIASATGRPRRRARRAARGARA